jgi:putative membrane protein
MATEEPSQPTGPRTDAVPWWRDGEEPDYRATLANERTFLAWTRTAMALLAGSLAVLQLSQIGSGTLRLTLTCYLIALSVGTLLLGYHRWRSTQHRMRRGLPLSHAPHQLLVTLAVLVLVGLISVIAATTH